MTKVFKLVLGTLGVLSMGALLFNHVDPWAGIAFVLTAAYLAFRFMDKEIGKNE